MKHLRDMDGFSHTLHAHARKKGFYEVYDNMDESEYIVFYLKQLAMIHSEVSEVLEAMRKEKGDDIVVEELADIIIRVLDFWAFLSQTQYTNVSLADAVVAKMEKNLDRPKMHGVLA
jgi:NTP pyrophosphatase (non-canonical NTP hydrolase)